MKSVETVLKEVFQNPTAPYRENWVLDYVKSELMRLKIPYVVDSCGNVIAGVSSRRELKKSRRVGLVAHTDHPGFHICGKIKNGRAQARWFGGCPPKIKGAKIVIYNPSRPSQKTKGKIVSSHLKGKKRLFWWKTDDLSQVANIDEHCFGAFDFPGFSRRRDKIFTRVADDLAGVTIILCTLARLRPQERKGFLGVFTRAEEVGFRGALGIIYEETIGKNNTVISLEASRQLPGARLGRGPVIRLGDKRTLFDSDLISRLDLAADALKKKNKKFTVQRRIMNGGTCEATPFNLHGIFAAGIAVPLGNYHNERPDGRPGAEFIDLRDVEGAVMLCVEFYRHLSKRSNPTDVFMKELARGFKHDRRLLTTRIPFERRAP